ncbi:serine/threonine-protein phosphatase pp2a-related [Anaeramoeba flamelloides]|uniref:protein-serine/threonine phosphatase n=1 Tax=Anaeramoeba flamelloides TaxID=1746091 RepID=A0AAV7ZTW8_9EUKA|nr:serine/threonine-protein phosphatase pp2a-related [Anaeramoeba flamelloides]
MNQTTNKTKKKIENKNLKLKSNLPILSPPISKKKIKNPKKQNSSQQKIPQIKQPNNSKNGFERILEAQITEIMQFELLNETELIQLCEKAKEIFMKEKNIFAIHGGLSPDISKIDQIQKIYRFIDIPFTGPLCDLVWSDPDQRTGFNENSRGAGFTFGPNITERFLKTNKLNLIVRAHQLFQRGYNITHSEKCITIFSAPNYCGSVFNLASIMKIKLQLETEIVQFKENKGKNPKPRIKW